MKISYFLSSINDKNPALLVFASMAPIIFRSSYKCSNRFIILIMTDNCIFCPKESNDTDINIPSFATTSITLTPSIILENKNKNFDINKPDIQMEAIWDEKHNIKAKF